ncbi:MAG: DNA topoisomerase 3 [Defluviitaleaceae bacterium]|nr:DNA topoisomerase 3 [Defluviitaleaceae bacterium]
MKLIIAEKPSVAKQIATVLNANQRKNGYFYGQNHIITWCVGHLIGLANAESYDTKYKKWNKEDLPILPQNFKYTVAEDKQEQLDIIKNLMQRNDVKEIINACDSGREGELIFRLVYNYNNCKLPIKRLWISSLEEKAIKQGFDNLKDGEDYENLYSSALSRMESDWTIGINSTRLFSVLYNANLNVGRVMSPTLALIVNRNKNIIDFVKEPFYTVTTEIDGFSFAHNSGKLSDKEQAEDILKELTSNLVVEKLEQTNRTTSPPKLFDLTSLQREANRIYGYSAKQTLDIAQGLYEKKLITYPRTDSKYITSDMKENALSTALSLANECNIVLENPNIINIIDNTKITDHHAIIPTLEKSKDELEQKEQNILKLITIRLLTGISPKYEYSETVVTLSCNNHLFTGKAKMTLKNGFKDVEKFINTSNSLTKEEKSLPKLNLKDEIKDHVFTIKTGETSPPKQYTEDTLLSAMETAGKEEMEDDVERKGLGTPATRAGIIEKLIQTNLIERRDKNLVPTLKGKILVEILPQQLKSPTLTAEWENKLKEVERGKRDSRDFMSDIERFVQQIVKDNTEINQSLYDRIPREKRNIVSVGICPRCKSEVAENKVAYSCINRDCKFAIFKTNNYFDSIGFKLTEEAVKNFLNKGNHYANLYSKQKNKSYNATLIMKDDRDGYTRFEMKFDKIYLLKK